MPIFMKYDGVDGSVTREGHEKWMELDSFSFGTGAASTVPDDVVVDGRIVTAAREDAGLSGFGDVLGGVFVGSGDTDGAAADRPTESLSLNFTKITYEAARDGDGITDLQAAAASAGGANVCLGDGSVRFVNDSINLDVF